MRRYKLERNFVELGDYLREGRDRARLTQREVSQALGYSSAQFISNFERGISPPPLEKLKTLAKTYRLPVSTVSRKLLEGVERKVMRELHQR